MFRKIINFYIEGFKGMTWGRSLWLVILLKLFLFFFVMKLFFFSDNLKSRAKSDKEAGMQVLENLTNTK